jgi:hypothetical protein
VFLVFGGAAVIADLGEGAFDDPAFRQHGEAFGGVRAFDHLHPPAGKGQHPLQKDHFGNRHRPRSTVATRISPASR